MAGHRHFNIHSSDHPLRKGVKQGQRSSHALHPLRRRSLRAQDLIEFALIFPVLMLFVFGIVDFGRAFHVLIAISNAAREGARVGILYGLNTDYTLKPNVIKQAAVFEAGNYNLQLDPAYVDPICICRTCAPGDENVCVPEGTLRVVVSYTFQPIMEIVFKNNLTLVRDMEMMIP